MWIALIAAVNFTPRVSSPVYRFRPVLLALAAALWPALAQPQSASGPEAVAPGAYSERVEFELAEVATRVALVRAELELIRFEMGKPRDERQPVSVKDAVPREAFFQALTLLRKANRLAFEQRRQVGTLPAVPDAPISAADVYVVVDAALEQIRLVKNTLGIVDDPQTDPSQPEHTASGVYSAIVQANRQLNLLLDQQFTPSDVFQQVTTAVGLAAHLLGELPGAARTPPSAPAFERGKRPGDVYRRLIDCFRLIRRIAVLSGLEMLTLETSQGYDDDVTPSDVYDIAALVVSELSYLHSRLEDARPHREVYYPGRKFPSHVYQRAGILEKQLIEIERRVQETPAWLRKS